VNLLKTSKGGFHISIISILQVGTMLIYSATIKGSTATIKTKQSK